MYILYTALLPRKLTWNLKMDPWKRRFLLETILFRFQPLVFGGAYYMILSILKYRSMVPKKTFLVSVLATFGDIFLLHASVFFGFKSMIVQPSKTTTYLNMFQACPIVTITWVVRFEHFSPYQKSTPFLRVHRVPTLLAELIPTKTNNLDFVGLFLEKSRPVKICKVRGINQNK